MIVISKADLVCKAMTSDSLGQHTELEELREKVRHMARHLHSTGTAHARLLSTVHFVREYAVQYFCNMQSGQ